MIYFSVMVGTKKMTDLLTNCIKIAIIQSAGKIIKIEILWQLPGMNMNTSKYSNSLYLILLKRTTYRQIAVFVNIYKDFVL